MAKKKKGFTKPSRNKDNQAKDIKLIIKNQSIISRLKSEYKIK